MTDQHFLESLMAPSGVNCTRCACIVALAPSSDEGRVMWLPPVTSITPDSCVFNDTQMQSAGAFNHPALPVMVSACGHMAFCLQMTSFNKRGIVAKCADNLQRGKRFDLDQFLALQEPDTVLHNGVAALAYDGPAMGSQSYVKLTGGFWIEADNLGAYGRGSGGHRQLRPAALSLLKAQVVNVETTRLARLASRLLGSFATECVPLPHFEQTSWGCASWDSGSGAGAGAGAGPLFTLPKAGNCAVAIRAPVKV